MSELPSGWTGSKLIEVCELNPRKPDANQVAPDTPVTFVPMATVNATSGTIATPAIRAYTSVAKGFTSFQEDDVIMAKITPCMENGKAAIARGLSNGLGFGSTEFHVFRPTGAAISEYIFHFIRQESFRKLAEANMTGSVGQKRVPAAFFSEIEIPLPPLNEQRRIIAKLEKLLGKVNACQQRLENIPRILKRFRQAVLAAACSGRLTEDWREENPQHHVSRGNGPANVPDIPGSWHWKILSDISQIRGGVTKGRKLNGRKTIWLPYLRVANVQDGYLDLNEVKQIEVLPEDKEKYALKAGDVLFTEGGDRDKLGRGTVWRGEIENCIHQNHIFRARLIIEEADADYLSIATKSDFSRSFFFDHASQTVNLASINLTTLSGLPIPLPPLAEQQEIVSRVEAFFKLADQLEARYQKAKAHVDRLQQSILAKAFRGELVPQDPDDEPASALLERIRTQRIEGVANNKQKKPRTATVAAQKRSTNNRTMKSQKLFD